MHAETTYNKAIARLVVPAIHKLMTHKYIWRLSKHSGVVFAFPGICIKSTSFTTIAEAEAMRFVSQNTTIPVPKVYCAFEHKGRVYIVMKRLAGRNLTYGWVQRPEESKTRILNEVRSMIQQLRNIPPPIEVGVSNICQGPIYDQRLPKKSTWGPFQTIEGFHLELRNGIETKQIRDDAAAPPDLKELASFHDQPWPRPVFTHGDLSSFNIIARGDEIVGIVDWETAGWMPPYWEYTSAWNVNPQNRFWQKEVDKFLDPLPYDLKMEAIRRKYFGDF